LAFGVAHARPSNPVGVIGVIQKVILSPDETQPTTAQIWGAFAISDGAMINYSDWPTSYSKPRVGYLYYKPAVGLLADCQKEWLDLKAMAGTKSVVAFGYRGNVTWLRAADVKLAAPDTYPLNVGLVVMAKSDDPGGDMTRKFFAELRNVAAAK
jgi:hypothetical protein